MRVIGIDPGIEKIGFAILEMQNGKLKILDCGLIMTDKRQAFSHRLNLLALDLKKLIKKWNPAKAGLEEIFFSKNIKTAIKVAHARGVILETLEEHGVAVKEFNPSRVKSAVTGDSRADKLQIRKMLQYILGIDIKQDDAADAIACGICLLSTKP